MVPQPGLLSSSCTLEAVTRRRRAHRARLQLSGAHSARQRGSGRYVDIFPPLLLFTVQSHRASSNAHVFGGQTVVRHSSRCCRVQPGVPRPALCYRVIPLVYSQSHVTSVLEMPQLIASPTMELLLPHELTNWHLMRGSTLMPRPRPAIPST
jgi:hypothetical protein